MIRKILIPLIAIFSIIASANSMAVSTEEESEIDIAFSKSSRTFLIDYRLIKSIGMATSGLDPNYVSIANEEIFLDTRVAADALASGDGWVLVMNMGNIRQVITIKDPLTISSFIEKYGSTRDYKLIKIDRMKLKIGIMGITPVTEKDLAMTIEENVFRGSKKFKDMIKTMGLRNALHKYCACKDPNKFYQSVANHYKDLTNKDLEELFR